VFFRWEKWVDAVLTHTSRHRVDLAPTSKEKGNMFCYEEFVLARFFLAYSLSVWFPKKYFEVLVTQTQRFFIFKYYFEA